MRALVIYDSFFGNTEKVAQAIGSALIPPEQVQVLRVTNANPEPLAGLDLLIVGSPTRGFRPTPAIVALVESIPARALQGVRVAAFDTRFTSEKMRSSAASMPLVVRAVGYAMVNVFGYAAKPIADGLQKKGGRVIVPPEGFFVEDTEGPLKEGELERAANWARQILAAP